MANLITHIIIGEKVITRLPQHARVIVENNKKAFIYGCIGPDFLFALREIGDKAARYCNVMQYSKNYQVFNAISEYLNKVVDSDKLGQDMLSYTLGLLCHYVVDSRLHPFVCSFVEKNDFKIIPTNQQKGIHGLIESALDEYLLISSGYKDSNFFYTPKYIATDKKTRKAIARVYKQVINNIVGFNVGQIKISLAILLTKLSMAFVVDKSGRKKAFFSNLEQKNDSSGSKKIRNLLRPPEYYGEVDYLNIRQLPYRSVINLPEEDNLTAIEIVDNATNMSVDYIVKFISSIKDGTPLDANDFIVNYEGVATNVSQ